MRYLVDVKEIYSSSVVVEADSIEEAEKIAVALCIEDDDDVIHKGFSFECVSEPFLENEV